MFNNALTLSFDYFFRKRENVIARANSSIPSTLGVAVADQNLYEFSNEGFEFSLNYRKQLNDNLKVNALLNFSKSREKAVFIDETFQEDPFMRDNLTVTGGYTNLRRGYISQGLFQSQDQIDQWAIQDGNGNSSLQPGDIRYQDLNGDNIIDVKDQKVFGPRACVLADVRAQVRSRQPQEARLERPSSPPRSRSASSEQVHRAS